MPFTAGMYYSISEEGSREKPSVVLIHGAGANHLYWPPELRRLPGYRVIAPDLPGHGRSGGSGQQSVWNYADQLVRFLAELGLYQAVFIGHSLGGCIALALALEHTGNVMALGLISSGAHIDVPEEVFTYASSPATFHLAIEAMKPLIFSPYTKHAMVQRGLRQLAETRPGVLFGDFLACRAFDIVDRIADIAIPAIIMCGCDDRMTPPNYSQYLAVNLGSRVRKDEAGKPSRLVMVPSAGHLIILEQPQVVKQTLAGFLNQVCGG